MLKSRTDARLREPDGCSKFGVCRAVVVEFGQPTSKLLARDSVWVPRRMGPQLRRLLLQCSEFSGYLIVDDGRRWGRRGWGRPGGAYRRSTRHRPRSLDSHPNCLTGNTERASECAEGVASDLVELPQVPVRLLRMGLERVELPYDLGRQGLASEGWWYVRQVPPAVRASTLDHR
jgi:hypothetical protein